MLKQIVFLAAPAVLSVLMTVSPLQADSPNEISFNLAANPKFAACLAADPLVPATAKVTVSRGTVNDILIVQMANFKPGLVFDLFSTEHTNLKSEGVVDPLFKGFGLAWYQSDIKVGDDGKAEAVVKTILLDHIFGFDADPIPGSVTGAPLVPPTGTFHLGFWFDSPKDATACGFDPSKPTPFNAVHKAGPTAMISIPDLRTGLGPLSTANSSSASVSASQY